MSFRKMALAAAVGAAMASTPVLAQANEASSLSVASAVRSGAEMNDASNQTFDEGWIVPGIIIVGVIVVLVLIYTSEDDDEDSISV